MTTVLRKKLCVLLLFWVFMLLCLAILVFHDLGTPFSVIVHTFQKDASIIDTSPLTAEEPLPVPQHVITEPEPLPPPMPKPELPLLPKGTENGKATFQKVHIGTTPPQQQPDAIPLSEGQVMVTIAYEGSLKAYTTFTVNAQRARVLDFHGTIQCPYQNDHLDAPLPIRLIQMAQHKGYARVSLLGRSPVLSFTEEVRYTDTMIYIILTPVK